MISITQKILQVAAPYEAVAFDVFDTLLKRDVGRPTDLFMLRGEEFAKKRVAAEKQVRLSEKREVTLADIYAQPEMAGYDPAQECAQELSAVVANQPVLEAVRILHSQGKRLYFISDMYLPQEQVYAMLLHCGYDMLDGGFVSCSYGVQKRSGALFHCFLRETGLASGKVLFIGDDWRADVLGAALAGIRAWHLPAPRPVHGNVVAGDLASGALHSFTQNRLTERSYDGWALGFAVLGPLEVAFCHWIHEQRRKGNGRLYFLARDMYLTRTIYALLYPEENTGYLQVSRRSLCPALLAKQQYSLLAAALPRQVLNGRQISDYCGAVCPEERANTCLNLKTEQDTEALYTLLEELQPPQDALEVLEYLAQAGLQTGDILVDIGSGGTTQMLLEALCGIQLHGLQISGDERLRARQSEENVQAQVFLTLEEKASKLYWAGQPMLEKMISEDTGSAVGYRRNNGRFEVVRAEQQKEPSLEEIQQGACAFAAEWQNSILHQVKIPAKLAIEPFLTLVAKPDHAQLALLGDLCVEDGGVYPLAAPGTLAEYFLHPHTLKKDLAAARWKIGFLARLLPLPLPYDRLYLSMKK